MSLRALVPIAFAVSVSIASGPGGAQTAAAYPAKPIRIVTSPAGGGDVSPPGSSLVRALRRSDRQASECNETYRRIRMGQLEAETAYVTGDRVI
jgi:hypothetical protein